MGSLPSVLGLVAVVTVDVGREEMIGFEPAGCGADFALGPDLQLLVQLGMLGPIEPRSEEGWLYRIEKPAVEGYPVVKVVQGKIEREGEVTGQPQTHLVVDRALVVDLGIAVQTRCGLRGRGRVWIVRRSDDGKSVAVVVDAVGIAGEGAENVGRPLRTVSKVFSDLAAAIVVERKGTGGRVAVEGFGWDRTECWLEDHGSIVRIVSALLRGPSPPGTIQDKR